MLMSMHKINGHHYFSRKPSDSKTTGCEMKNRGNENKREWLYSEIDELKAYVLTQTSDEEMDTFVSRVNELDTHQRNGYPCRDCGMIFKYHSIRVEYV